MTDYVLTISDDLISDDRFRGVLHLESDRAVAFCHDRSCMSGDVWSGETIELDLPYYCSPRLLQEWFSANLEQIITLKNRVNRYYDGSRWKGRVTCLEHADGGHCDECYCMQLEQDRALARLEQDLNQSCATEYGDADSWWDSEIQQVGREGVAAIPFEEWWDGFLSVAQDADQYLDRDEFEVAYQDICDSIYEENENA